MSHPLDDVQNTPWGQEVSRRLLLIEQELSRFPLMESEIRGLDTNIAMLSNQLSENKKSVAAIKADTEWLIDVFKGAKASGPLIGWIVVTMTGIVTVITGIIFLIKGKGI